MKKKAIKIAASTAVAASAFVAAAPAQQADAATNVNQLVTDAQNAGTVLKWAISVEGSADYVTRPYDQYNAAKKAIAAAEAAAKKLSASEKLSVDAKLVEPKLQVKRAAAYIDAITSSEKIKDLTTKLDAAIKSDDIEKVETAYHAATGEYRKQAALLDRVYGQSTRDGIRNAVKPAIEKLVASVKNEVTVNMLAKSAAANNKAGKLVEAAQNLSDAQAILDANVLKWETSLQKSVNDVAEAMPLRALSITRLGENKLVVNLSKAPGAVSDYAAGQFSFDKGLLVQSAVLNADGKSVTLTTTGEKAGQSYSLTYKGAVTELKYVTPASPADPNFVIGETEVSYQEEGTSRAYTITFKNTDGSLYTGAVDLTLVNEDTTTPATLADAFISNIEGVAVNTVSAPATVVGLDGKLTFVVSGSAATSSKVEPLVKFDGKEKRAGATYFYQKATSAQSFASNIDGALLDKVDKEKKSIYYNGFKYTYDTNDLFYIKGQQTTLEKFADALSSKDLVNFQYTDVAAGTSVWNIIDDVTLNSVVKITNPSKDVSYDGFTYQLKGTGHPGYTVNVYSKADATFSTLLGTAVVGTNGEWIVQVSNVAQNAVNEFTVVQAAPGQTVAEAAVVVGQKADSKKVYVGAYEIKTAGFVPATTPANDNVVGFQDQLDLTFLNADAGEVFETLAAADKNYDIKVATGAKIVVKDNLGKKATLTVKKVDFNTVEIIDVLNAEAGFNSADTVNHRIESISGITNQDNLSLKLPTNSVITF